ncbi:hypothetical protein JHK82_022706 [Glycine max]|nr:hypothetical protein JHK85_023197 [Glycine max]KAG5137975.1 hypothetical protein JHK82_022706 [Glycine max]
MKKIQGLQASHGTTSHLMTMEFLSNLHLLYRNSPQYNQGKTKMWDIAEDEFGPLDDNGTLEVAQLSLDEPELEVVFFNDGEQEQKEMA